MIGVDSNTIVIFKNISRSSHGLADALLGCRIGE
jgi:hypothetical protein